VQVVRRRELAYVRSDVGGAVKGSVSEQDAALALDRFNDHIEVVDREARVVGRDCTSRLRDPLEDRVTWHVEMSRFERDVDRRAADLQAIVRSLRGRLSHRNGDSRGPEN